MTTIEAGSPRVGNAVVAPNWPAKFDVFGLGISRTTYDEAVETILYAARRHSAAVVSCFSAHALMTASRDPELCRKVNTFEMITPDGQPVRWALNLLNRAGLKDRVYGPELALRLCRKAAEQGVGVYLLGGSPSVVEALAANLTKQCPGLQIAGAESPPFRDLSPEEDGAMVRRIEVSGAGIVLVGLGCPKQDVFAFAHREQIPAVQVCVGAAFDFHAGAKKMAPPWMQRRGLEWLFRLGTEPRRLWRRYLTTNTLYLLTLAGTLVRRRLSRRRPTRSATGAAEPCAIAGPHGGLHSSLQLPQASALDDIHARMSNTMGDRNPKVSIGLPVFNGARFLAETIDCLLAQTYEDFELVISDNASTDGTENICRGYAARDPRVRYERQEVNRGATWNFNHVFRLARGQYFKWAAHDDLLAPTFLARCVEVLDDNPAVAWCQTRVAVVDARGHVVESHGLGQLCGAAETLMTWRGPCQPQVAAAPATHYAHQRFRRVLLGSTSCIDVCGLIRIADLQGTSLWQPYFGWEKVLSGELSLRGRCAEIPEKLFLYRIHEDACSALGSAEQHNAWCDPSATMRSSLVRFRFLMGHIHAVIRAPIGCCDRALCLLWIGVYLLQFRKWPSVVRQIFGRHEIGSGTRDALRALRVQERQTGEVPEMAGHSGVGLSPSTKVP